MSYFADCYCQASEQNGFTEVTRMVYLGDGKFRCPKCNRETAEFREDVFKVRLRIAFDGATIIEPFDAKLLAFAVDSGGKPVEETEKDLLQDYIDDEGMFGKHETGVFDMELVCFDYRTAPDVCEYDTVFEVLKETKVGGLTG